LVLCRAQFVVDDLLKGGFRLSAAKEDSVDEKAWRRRDAGFLSIILIARDLRFVLSRCKARLERLLVQSECLSDGIEATLV